MFFIVVIDISAFLKEGFTSSSGAQMPFESNRCLLSSLAVAARFRRELASRITKVDRVAVLKFHLVYAS
jgi:hypothetical protein